MICAADETKYSVAYATHAVRTAISRRRLLPKPNRVLPARSSMLRVFMRHDVSAHSINGLPPSQVSSIVRSSVGSVIRTPVRRAKVGVLLGGEPLHLAVRQIILLADTDTRCVPGMAPSSPS